MWTHRLIAQFALRRRANRAPALAQADVGIAMGAAGTDIAIEAAHIALMREDWTLVPEVVRIARRTMRIVKMNLAFAAIYNVAGWAGMLALLGFAVARANIIFPAMTVPEFDALRLAYTGPGLAYQYFPTTEEWLLAVWLVGAAGLAFLVAQKWVVPKLKSA